MKISITTGNRNWISSYSETGFLVNQTHYSTNLLIGRSYAATAWEVKSPSDIMSDSILKICQLKPEIIIIGMGNQHTPATAELSKPALDKGIGIEFMDSRAACRCYNLLLEEEREVIAGLILPTIS